TRSEIGHNRGTIPFGFATNSPRSERRSSNCSRAPAMAGLRSKPAAGFRLPAYRQEQLRMRRTAMFPRLTILFPLIPLMALPALTAFEGHAFASTITQNVSWTIDRPGSTTKYRIVAYGDSIFAGYKGSPFEVAIYAAPTVD